MRLVRSLALVAFLGLWLMHGMSATTGAGCHGVPMMMPMTATASEAAIMHAPADGASLSQSTHEQSGSGEMCLSGQPPSPGNLLIALLAALAVFALALFTVPTPWPVGNAPAAWRRRGPPGLAGNELLTAVCVSRT